MNTVVIMMKASSRLALAVEGFLQSADGGDTQSRLEALLESFLGQSCPLGHAHGDPYDQERVVASLTDEINELTDHISGLLATCELCALEALMSNHPYHDKWTPTLLNTIVRSLQLNSQQQQCVDVSPNVPLIINAGYTF